MDIGEELQGGELDRPASRSDRDFVYHEVPGGRELNPDITSFLKNEVFYTNKDSRIREVEEGLNTPYCTKNKH